MADRSRAPLEPTRDPRVTLPDLLEVLLNRGVVLHLDLIVAVADIPLIGVSLKAAIAGIETMLEYGMMRQWDEETRAWVQRSISRTVPFAEGEELIARMAGSHEQASLYTTWRPGTFYLTDRRLFVFRREPRELLWQAPLERIAAVDLEPDRSVGGEDRLRLRITLDDGAETRLSAAEPERIRTLIREQVAKLGGTLPDTQPPTRESTAGLLRTEMVWYHEPRAAGAVWRRGTARLDRRGLRWKSDLDARAAVDLAPTAIRGMRLERGDAPGGVPILVLDTATGVVRLAAEDAEGWAESILELLDRRLEAAAESAESDAGPEGADGWR